MTLLCQGLETPQNAKSHLRNYPPELVNPETASLPEAGPPESLVPEVLIKRVGRHIHLISKRILAFRRVTFP